MLYILSVMLTFDLYVGVLKGLVSPPVFKSLWTDITHMNIQHAFSNAFQLFT